MTLKLTFGLSRYLDVNDLPENYICIICRMASAGHFSDNKMSEARSYLPSLTLERRALTKMFKKKSFESVDNIQREIGELYAARHRLALLIKGASDAPCQAAIRA
jgi:hypothetical protein